MKTSRIIIGVLLAALPPLAFSSCGGDEKCVDEQTGIVLACDAYELLKAERAKSDAIADAGAPTDVGADADGNTNQLLGAEIKPQDNIHVLQPVETPASNPNMFESREYGFRIPKATGLIEQKQVPSAPTEFTMTESTEAVYAVHFDGAQCGRGFLIIAERNDDELREDGITPKEPSSEGFLTENTVDLPNGIKGYLYGSNALGFYDDPHITVFAGQRVYHLRERNSLCLFSPMSTGTSREVSEALINFARTFEVNLPN